MRTEVDLDAAAQAGIIGEDQAIALRNFQAESDGYSAWSSEKFQLFGGYADLVIGIGAAMVFFAAILGITELGDSLRTDYVWLVLSPAAMAFAAFYTARRVNMRASPALAMVLTVAYAGFSMFAITVAMIKGFEFFDWSRLMREAGAVLAALPFHIAVMWAFWRSFRFPPTIAMMIAAYAFAILAVLAEGFYSTPWIVASSALLIATGTMIAAIWWDLTDLRRETERSQVAFWLHCCAGVLMSRALFALLTGHEIIDDRVFFTGLEFSDAPFVLILIAVAAVISLLLDRRSLLVGCLVPTVTIFDGVGRSDSAAAMGLAMAGGALIVFSVMWPRLRTHLLAVIPEGLAAQLPRTNLVAEGQRPTRQHKELWHLR